MVRHLRAHGSGGLLVFAAAASARRSGRPKCGSCDVGGGGRKAVAAIPVGRGRARAQFLPIARAGGQVDADTMSPRRLTRLLP